MSRRKWNGSIPGGGLSRVSADMGKELYAHMVMHDDGMKGMGGNRTMIVGELGSGKTTLGIETVPKIRCIPNMKKADFFKNLTSELVMTESFPETVIWRGRKRDYWNVFTKKNWGKSYPNLRWRKLRVFYYHEDSLQFFEDDGDSPKLMEGVDIYKYKDMKDLYNNIVKGGVNVIYVPKVYYLPDMLKKILNEIQLLEEHDKRYIHDDDHIHVPNFVFWYEFFYFLIEIDKNFDKVATNYRKLRWFTFIFDEAHQIFPVAQKPLWHLVDHFAEHELIDTRRINISIIAQVHEVSYVYWKVVNRFSTFIWLPGAKANKSRSTIDQHLINQLPIGMGIIEKKGGRFGKFDFPQIKNQPAILTVNGYD